MGTIKLALSSLEANQRLAFIGLVVMRVLLNGLDVAGLVLIGLLATLLVSDGSEASDLSSVEETYLAIFDGSILWLSSLVVLVFALKSVLALFLMKRIVRFLARVETKKSELVAGYLFSGGLQRVEVLSEGEIFWATHTSTNQAFTGMLTMVASLIAEGSLLLSIFVLFVLVDPVVAALSLAYFAILGVIFQASVSWRLRHIGTELADSSARINDHIRQMVGGFREIRTTRRTASFVAQFGKQRSRWAESSASQQLLLSLPRYFVETALMVGVLFLLVFQVARGEPEQGLASTAIFLGGGLKMMAAMIPLQNSIASLRILVPQSVRALGLLVAADRESQTSSDQVKARPHRRASRKAVGLEFSEVSFSHVNASGVALDSVSVAVPRGSITAVVGKSGAGKSTLVDTLLGLRSPESGTVSIEGMDPTTFISGHPGIVAYVPQSPKVFMGSVVQNVALGVPLEQANESRVRECLKRVALDDWVARMPDGLYSTLGEQNQALSGGQRQRLGLARALYENPKLLVVDEPTTGLDSVSSQVINDLLLSLAPSATVIIVAHHLLTVKIASQILVMDKGRVVGLGSYEDLAQGNSHFQRLFG